MIVQFSVLAFCSNMDTLFLYLWFNPKKQAHCSTIVAYSRDAMNLHLRLHPRFHHCVGTHCTVVLFYRCTHNITIARCHLCPTNDGGLCCWISRTLSTTSPASLCSSNSVVVCPSSPPRWNSAIPTNHSSSWARTPSGVAAGCSKGIHWTPLVLL